MTEAQRPWLVADAMKDKDGRTLRITRRGELIDVEAEFKLRNTGHSAAKGISAPMNLRVECCNGVVPDTNVHFDRPASIDLAPGDSVIAGIRATMKGNDVDALETQLNSDNSAIEIGVSWSYGSELSDRCYKTRILVELRRRSDRLLRQDHETIEAKTGRPCGDEGIQ